MPTPPRRLDFRDHRRELHDNRYIYAVISRRARGLSIGVNLNPDKACNFACPYCQVDRTVPGGPRAVDIARLQAELRDLLARVVDGTLWDVSPFDTADPALRRVADIALAGDGEPTAAAEFPEALAAIGDVRAEFKLERVALSLLTNATLLHRPRVRQGLAHLDALGGELWAKLDAGTEAWFRITDGTSLPFSRVLDNLRDAARARPIVLQSMFHTWDGAPPPPGEAAAWAARIGAILDAGGAIRQIQIYSVARRPADARVGALAPAALEVFAEAARAAVAGRPTAVVVFGT